MRKIVFTTALILVLLAMFAVPNVSASTEGSVSGSFGISAPPSVDSISLTATSLTPQTSYTINSTLSDPDKISNVNTAVLKGWYDSDGGAPTEGEFDAVTANTQNGVIVTWTHTGGITSTTVLTPTAGGSTWVLGAYSVPTTLGHFDGTSFPFSFNITVGKVATETSGAGLWQWAIKVTDATAQTDFDKDAEGASMNWYGEITVPSTTVSWGGISRGVDFGGTNSQKALGVTVNYKANGAYDEKAKSSASWTGATYTATLDSAGTCDDNNEFALKADDAAVITAAVLLDATGVTLDDTGAQTAEAGDSVANYNYWIKLAASFDSDNFSGTLTFIVANGI